MRYPLPFLMVWAMVLGLTGLTNAQEDEFVTVTEFDDAMQEVDSLRAQLDRLTPGDTNFMWTGFATASYVDGPGESSTFSASFSPVFLWQLGDKLFFEGEMEFESGGEAEMEYAQILYQVADDLTLGAGQFLSPFGVFAERVHPSWINRLPGSPYIAGHDGLAPNSVLGAQLRGAKSVGLGKINYVVFVGNGPQLNNGLDEEDEAGLLHWDPTPDVDQNKMLGGRLGWVAMPGLEVGASAISAKAAGEGTSESSLDVNLFGLDFTYQREIDEVYGVLRLDGEFVQSDVSTATYFPGTAEANSFSNERSGGYGQLAFRPTKVDSAWLQNVEVVTRYDWLDLPDGAPEDEKHTRWTFGLDYWLSPSTVVKVAVDNQEIGDEPSDSTFYLQIALGF